MVTGHRATVLTAEAVVETDDAFPTLEPRPRVGQGPTSKRFGGAPNPPEIVGQLLRAKHVRDRELTCSTVPMHAVARLERVQTKPTTQQRDAHPHRTLISNPSLARRGIDAVVVLRPPHRTEPALVDVVYETENTGAQRTVELVFVSGPMISDSASVTLDGRPIRAVWNKVDALPPAWQAPSSTPAISGKEALPYEGGVVLKIPRFVVTLTPGRHQLHVRYAAKPTSHSTSRSPMLFWQLAFSADSFVTESSQRSELYGNIYFLGAVAVFCTAAVPVGAAITLARAVSAFNRNLHVRDDG